MLYHHTGSHTELFLPSQSGPVFDTCQTQCWPGPSEWPVCDLLWLVCSANDIFCTSNMAGHHRGPKRKLRAGYRAPSLKWTSHVAMQFYRWAWYLALSLCYACIWSSSIILISYATFVPNFVSFVASIAELALGEKSRVHLLTRVPSLFDTPRTKLSLRKRFTQNIVNKSLFAKNPFLVIYK